MHTLRMRPRLWRSVLMFFPMLISLFATSCYYTTQGYYLLSYTTREGTKIENILANPQTPQDTRNFLQTVQDIRVFVRDTAHLSISKHYKKYLELDRDYLLAVVQAAPELGLDPYTWKYPFMGALPYRGFYKIADAKREAQKLKKKGNNVYIRPVRAFSTLNILPDPVYSFMKNYSEGELAELIAHEQTHATIWVPKRSDFNEPLAAFVGRQAALLYIADTYGTKSDEYSRLRDESINYAAFISFLYAVKARLAQVYGNTALTRDEKLQQKQLVLQEAHAQFTREYDTLFTDDRYKKFDITQYNNAFFATISLYEDNKTVFEDAYRRCGSDIAKFIDRIAPVVKKPHRKNPFGFLDTICK